MADGPSNYQYPPPVDWQLFERNMRDLFQAEWNAPATMNGRSGQPQHGVDIYGQPNRSPEYHGVQCKGKDALLQSALTKTELRNEVRKATKFRPKLAHFILATTGPRDATIQKVARELNDAAEPPFSVQVMFWPDILDLYKKHPKIFARHYQPTIENLHQLPPPPADFTGRSDELADLLAHFRTGVTISGLRGMGGIGKTALARVLAHQLKDQYPDAQFNLDLQGTSSQPLAPSAALAHVVLAYRPAEKLPESESDLRNLFLHHLNGQRAILLMDNAADAAQVAPLIPPASCILIVTSRRYFTLPGLYPIDLHTLPEPDAIALLIRICPRLATSSEIENQKSKTENLTTLARFSAYLPIAIRATASRLAETPDLRIPDYIGQLQDENARLTALEYPDLPDIPRDVIACFNRSYAYLLPDAARVFRALSVFPATFDSAAEEFICQDSNHEILSSLVRLSLVEYDDATNRYHLHDLVRLFAAQKLDDSPEPSKIENQKSKISLCLRHAAHYLALLRSADALFLEGDANILSGLKLFDLDRHNIQSAQSFAASHAETDDSAAHLANDYPTAGVYVLDLRLHPQEHIHWLESAISAARRLNDRQAEGNHLGNLGLAHADLGDPRRAIDYHEQALKIDREIGDRRGEGADLGNLGSAYYRLGDPRRAIDYYEQCLTLHREIGDRRAEGADLGNLGLAYADLGDPRRAIDYYEQALKIIREIGDRRGEGNALGNLGSAHAALGDPRRAIDYYEQALKIAREIGDRLGEGNALAGLGIAHAALGDPRRAIDYYEQALKIDREIGDRRGEALASWNLGDEYAKQGNLPAAIPAMQLRVDYLRELNHPDAEKDAAYVASLLAKLPSPP